MTDKTKADAKTRLSDSDITSTRPAGRRRFLGLMAAGSAAAAGLPRAAAAQATDADSGAWNDQAGCGRGPGGSRTGLTDADNGAISDAQGRGRGAPRC